MALSLLLCSSKPKLRLRAGKSTWICTCNLHRSRNQYHWSGCCVEDTDPPTPLFVCWSVFREMDDQHRFFVIVFFDWFVHLRERPWRVSCPRTDHRPATESDGCENCENENEHFGHLFPLLYPPKRYAEERKVKLFLTFNYTIKTGICQVFCFALYL